MGCQGIRWQWIDIEVVTKDQNDEESPHKSYDWLATECVEVCISMT